MEIVGGFSPARVGSPGAAASWKSRSVYFGYILRLTCRMLPAKRRGRAALGLWGPRVPGPSASFLSTAVWDTGGVCSGWHLGVSLLFT